MLFQRKAKNRRFEREHVLDVRIQSQLRRKRRMRIASAGFSLLVGTLLSAYLLWYGSHWALDKWVFQNTAFNINRIEIRTDGILPLDQIRRWMGVTEGNNLLAADLARIKRDLELQSMIHSAAVERVLPGTLRIHVTEREPVARISGFRASPATREVVAVTYYLDREGVFIQAHESVLRFRPVQLTFEALPTLTGVPGFELVPGKRASSPHIHAALALIASFERSPMAPSADLQAIDVASPPVLRVTTRQGNEVSLASEDFPQQLRRWRLVHDYAHREGKAIATLDLSVANNVPARWQQAAPEPPPARKPAKPSLYRKKHV